MALRTVFTDFAATEYSIYVSFHDDGLTRFRKEKSWEMLHLTVWTADMNPLT